MAINLKKGSSFNLTKNEPGLKKIMIGLGWDFLTSTTIDIDASVFLLKANGKILDDAYFVFYNNLKSPDGSIQHMGDNRTGKGEGDDELVLANLSLVDPQITDIALVATIHEASVRRQNFGLLKDAYIRLFDVDTEREILRYDLDAEFSTNTEVEFGRLQRIDGEWRFFASGVGSNIGLEGLLNLFV
jgi:tellurium resistance protein TerD